MHVRCYTIMPFTIYMYSNSTCMCAASLAVQLTLLVNIRECAL